MLKKRKKAVGVRAEETMLRLQNQIYTLIRANQVNAVQSENLIDPNIINAYSQTINTNNDYSTPPLLDIPQGTRIPFLSSDTVYNFLRKQKRSSPGPDNLPYWFYNKYAFELAPVLTEIFNVSLKI